MLPSAACHHQRPAAFDSKGRKQFQRKLRFPQSGIQRTAKDAAPRPVKFRLGRLRLHQRGKVQQMNLVPHRFHRCAGRVVTPCLRRHKGSVHGLQQGQFPGVPSRGLIAFVGGVGVQLPEDFFAAGAGGLQRKRAAVGGADSTDHIKVKAAVQPLQFPAGVHHPPGGVKHQLAHCRHHGGRVAQQPGQTQRQGGPLPRPVFQRRVHHPLVGKGQSPVRAAGQRRRRGLTVPQMQQMNRMPLPCQCPGKTQG